MRAIAHCLRATTYCPTPFYLQLTAHHTPAQVAERRKLEAQEAALAQNAKWQRQHAMQARSISRAVGGAIKAEGMMMLTAAARLGLGLGLGLLTLTLTLTLTLPLSQPAARQRDARPDADGQALPRAAR